MAGVSNYALKQILLATFGKNVTIPGTWYLALCKATPTAASTGSTISEPLAADYGGYARVAIPNDTADWDQTTGGINLKQIVFPTSTGGASSPVTLPAACLCDALTGGNMWFFGAFSANLIIASGQAPLFNAGDIAFSLV